MPLGEPWLKQPLLQAVILFLAFLSDKREVKQHLAPAVSDAKEECLEAKYHRVCHVGEHLSYKFCLETTFREVLRIMKQGNSISSPSNCNCANLQLRLLSIPSSLFSDRLRASIMSIIAFIALVASFSLKNLPISEKTFVPLLLGIRLLYFFVGTSKLQKFRDIRKSLCSFLYSILNLRNLNK